MTIQRRRFPDVQIPLDDRLPKAQHDAMMSDGDQLRPGFQFRLRTLFIVTTLAAIMSGLAVTFPAFAVFALVPLIFMLSSMAVLAFVELVIFAVNRRRK